MRASIFCALLIITIVQHAPAEEPEDVTISWPYGDAAEFDLPATTHFYYNGRAVGEGRKALAEIVARVRRLPAGTSIVWGPNFARCGACSGEESDCLAEALYPDLWAEFKQAAKKQQLALSSDYPGPHIRAVQSLSDPTIVASLPEKSSFDGRLDWEIGAALPKDDNPLKREFLLPNQQFTHVFRSGGKVLDEHGRDLVLGKVPAGGSLVIHVATPHLRTGEKGSNAGDIAAEIRGAWRMLSGACALGKLRVTLVAAEPLVDLLREDRRVREPLQIDWDNYHGPATPHAGVCYRVDGRYVGRGDKGFDQVLTRLTKLEPGTKITLPFYAVGGRWAAEMLSDEERKEANRKLLPLVPYAARRKELAAFLEKQRLIAEPYDIVLHTTDPITLLDWHGGSRYGAPFASYGRIVRYDEKPRPAAARLGWHDYDPHRGKRLRDKPRDVESNATYTLDGKPLGQGAIGFAAAMKRLEALPEGSVVHVPVCIRTQGPFLCPLIYEGKRHFERTGFEPYFGMYPWLLDVARWRKLEIEWIPDEAESFGDCALNK